MQVYPSIVIVASSGVWAVGLWLSGAAVARGPRWDACWHAESPACGPPAIAAVEGVSAGSAGGGASLGALSAWLRLTLRGAVPHADTEEQLGVHLVRDPHNPPSQRMQGDMIPDLQPARFTRKLEVHNCLIVKYAESTDYVANEQAGGTPPHRYSASGLCHLSEI
jgi:hypothetical protein